MVRSSLEAAQLREELHIPQEQVTAVPILPGETSPLLPLFLFFRKCRLSPVSLLADQWTLRVIKPLLPVSTGRSSLAAIRPLHCRGQACMFLDPSTTQAAPTILYLILQIFQP